VGGKPLACPVYSGWPGNDELYLPASSHAIKVALPLKFAPEFSNLQLLTELKQGGHAVLNCLACRLQYRLLCRCILQFVIGINVGAHELYSLFKRVGTLALILNSTTFGSCRIGIGLPFPACQNDALPLFPEKT
jgi:hypothetical protein